MGLFSRLFGNKEDSNSHAGPASAGEYEASMNFDLETVRPFLHRLQDRRRLVFDVDRLARFAEETSVENERETAVPVSFEGRGSTLRYSVFMDDIDAPDLYFFSSDKGLIDAIDAEYTEFTEELGI